MITPILERALLDGTASFYRHNHAFGMLGRIPMRDGKVAVITSITWTPFIDFPLVNLSNNSWAYFFRNVEFQLKIEGANNMAVYQFRNNIKFAYTDPTKALDLTASITSGDFKSIILQPGDPVTLDSYLMIQGTCKIIISRNPFVGFTDTVGPPNPKPMEARAPVGVGDIDLLKQTRMGTNGGQFQYYNPASPEWDDVSLPARGKQNYVQDYYGVDGAFLNSQLNPPDVPSGFGTSVFATQPLVCFDVVYINKNIADGIQSNK